MSGFFEEIRVAAHLFDSAHLDLTLLKSPLLYPIRSDVGSSSWKVGESGALLLFANLLSSAAAYAARAYCSGRVNQLKN